MKYKYKLGEPVVCRKDTKDYPDVFFPLAQLYIVYNYVEQTKYFNKYDKKIFLSKGIIYEVADIDCTCYGEGDLGGVMTAKESQLSPYTGSDLELLLLFKEAKEKWLVQYENDDL